MKRFKMPVYVGFIIATGGLALAAFGIYRGEIDIVLKKAINICLECIGLG